MESRPDPTPTGRHRPKEAVRCAAAPPRRRFWPAGAQRAARVDVRERELGEAGGVEREEEEGAMGRRRRGATRRARGGGEEVHEGGRVREQREDAVEGGRFMRARRGEERRECEIRSPRLRGGIPVIFERRLSKVLLSYDTPCLTSVGSSTGARLDRPARLRGALERGGRLQELLGLLPLLERLLDLAQLVE